MSNTENEEFNYDESELPFGDENSFEANEERIRPELSLSKIEAEAENFYTPLAENLAYELFEYEKKVEVSAWCHVTDWGQVKLNVELVFPELDENEYHEVALTRRIEKKFQKLLAGKKTSFSAIDAEALRDYGEPV